MAPRAVLISHAPGSCQYTDGIVVDCERTLLHLGDQLLVEETLGLLVQWAVDGDHVTLGQHLLQVVDPSAADLLLDLRLEWLVVVVEELLAVEGLQSSQNSLTDSADGHGTDDLTLEVVLVLGDLGNVPVTSLDLLVGRDEVSNESQDGHDDVFGDGDDVGASDLGDGDTAIGLVGRVQVDVVGTNTSRHGDLQVLGFGQSLGGQVTRVEARGSGQRCTKSEPDGGIRPLTE